MDKWFEADIAYAVMDLEDLPSSLVDLHIQALEDQARRGESYDKDDAITYLALLQIRAERLMQFPEVADDIAYNKWYAEARGAK